MRFYPKKKREVENAVNAIILAQIKKSFYNIDIEFYFNSSPIPVDWPNRENLPSNSQMVCASFVILVLVCLES